MLYLVVGTTVRVCGGRDKGGRHLTAQQCNGHPSLYILSGGCAGLWKGLGGSHRPLQASPVLRIAPVRGLEHTTGFHEKTGSVLCALPEVGTTPQTRYEVPGCEQCHDRCATAWHPLLGHSP